MHHPVNNNVHGFMVCTYTKQPLIVVQFIWISPWIVCSTAVCAISNPVFDLPLRLVPDFGGRCYPIFRQENILVPVLHRQHIF